MDWISPPPESPNPDGHFGDYWSTDFSKVLRPEKKSDKSREETQEDGTFVGETLQPSGDPPSNDFETGEEKPITAFTEYPDLDSLDKYKNAIINYRKKHEKAIPSSPEGVRATTSGNFKVSFDDYMEANKASQSSLESARKVGSKENVPGSFIAVEIAEPSKTSPRKNSTRYAWS